MYQNPVLQALNKKKKLALKSSHILSKNTDTRIISKQVRLDLTEESFGSLGGTFRSTLNQAPIFGITNMKHTLVGVKLPEIMQPRFGKR